MTLALVSGSSASRTGATSLTLPAALTTVVPECPPGSKRAGEGCIDTHPVSVTFCPSARKAVKFYASRIAHWRAKTGAALHEMRVGRNHPTGCPRYLAHVLQRKAYALRLAYQRWYEYHFAWWKWLPDKWQRIGACETGYGRRPGNWTWDSGRYVSAFGIYRAGYADDAHRVGNLSWDETLRELHRLPTPREQYEAALSHYDAHGGFSGWGCRNA